MRRYIAARDSGLALLQRYRTTLHQGVWAFAGQAMAGIFNLGGTRLITQYVAPELYGVVSLVQNALILLRTLFCSPMFAAQLRYYPDAERGNYLPALHRMLRSALGKAVIGMELLAIVGASIWIWSIGGNVRVILALILYIAFDVFRTLEMTVFSAARRQRPAALASAAEALIRPLLVVVGVSLFGATVEVVLGAIAASIVVTLLGLYAGTGFESASGGVAMPPGIAAEMRRYALPLIPVAMLNWITSVSDRYIIQWVSHDLPSVGVYVAGYGLASQPFLILQMVILLTFRPVYFAAISRGDNRHAKRTFRTWLILSTAICSTATGLIFVWRNLLVSALLGPKYHNAVVVVPWIALGYLFYVVEQVFEQHLLAHKRTDAVLITQVCGAVASIAITTSMVASFGMVGAAYACPVYFLIQCLLAGTLASRASAHS